MLKLVFVRAHQLAFDLGDVTSKLGRKEIGFARGKFQLHIGSRMHCPCPSRT